MSFNNELYTKVLEKIKGNPQEWDQSNWCGTSCCFAGHAAVLSGYTQQAPDSSGYVSMLVIDPTTDDKKFVDEVAEMQLGLSEPQKDWLFSCGRTIEDFESFQAKLLVDPYFNPFENELDDDND